MSTERHHLGRCPTCNATIPERQLLIEYETTAGETAAFAECPECEDVVHPTEGVDVQ